MVKCEYCGKEIFLPLTRGVHNFFIFSPSKTMRQALQISFARRKTGLLNNGVWEVRSHIYNFIRSLMIFL